MEKRLWIRLSLASEDKIASDLLLDILRGFSYVRKIDSDYRIIIKVMHKRKQLELCMWNIMRDSQKGIQA